MRYVQLALAAVAIGAALVSLFYAAKAQWYLHLLKKDDRAWLKKATKEIEDRGIEIQREIAEIDEFLARLRRS